MSDLAQNQAGDLVFTNNELTFVEGADEVVQRLRQRLRTFKGEDFMNTENGVDYYGNVLIKNPSPTVVEATIKAEIEGTPGVISITAFNIDADPSTRTFTLNFAVQSVDGPIELEEIV
jgi:hypothetical protein